MGRQTHRLLAEFGVSGIDDVRTTRLFTIGLRYPRAQDESTLVERIANELLTDPVAETCRVIRQSDVQEPIRSGIAIERHLKPGVTDAAACSTAIALAGMGIEAVEVATAIRYEIHGNLDQAGLRRAMRVLANDCIEDVVAGGRPFGARLVPTARKLQLRSVSVTALDESGLQRLSRERHLFLSVEEMGAIRDYYRSLGREPTDLEIETIAQTWSEHCVHKTLRAAVEYDGERFPGEGRGGSFGGLQHASVSYANLLKETIVRATDELIRERRGPECISVFKDNAGVIAFDDRYGVAFKVETHNHPSAIEPYGGAATGIGGVIRDVMGCGLGGKPIANTDVFCVGPPDWPVEGVPRGAIHPRSILKGIVAGVRDYGNRMGIPTVNGGIHFDARYLGNPLVYCGCVGLIPRDRIDKRASPEDAVVLLGGRTGRDGIHGATFSSAELTDSHEDEFAHAVQIGNAVEEKKVLDVILQARDFPSERLSASEGVAEGATACLYSAITDCGAGGLSSSVGEMAAGLGAEINLEKVPLKYAGLRYDEIWISEAQERMVLAVPPHRVDAVLSLAASEDVEATVIGRFTDSGRLRVRYDGVEVGDLDLGFLHDGLPKLTRKAEWKPAQTQGPPADESGVGKRAAGRPTAARRPNIADACTAELRERLADATTASKHWVIRQYDHEVQGGSVIKPLAGPHDGPSDAAVIRPRLESDRGIAIGCGLGVHTAGMDPYWMAVAAIDEAIRNVVCVGGDPDKTALLDNFCWPRVDDARNLGALVRACQACYDAAKAYGTPFISGKDSLNNEFALDSSDVENVRRLVGETRCWSGHEDAVREGRLAIPYTLLISSLSLVADVGRCVTMDLKQKQARLYLIGQPTTFDTGESKTRPLFDLSVAAETHRTIARLIRERLVVAVHDVSEGGALVACAEMCLASDRSCRVRGFSNWASVPRRGCGQNGSAFCECGAMEDELRFYFSESPGLYLAEVANARSDEFEKLIQSAPALLFATVGERPPGQGSLFEIETSDGLATMPVRELRDIWRGTLDW